MNDPFFILAPMDDVTDTVFRRVVHDCGPADLYMTEFVNVDGLCSPGRAKLMHRLSLSADTGRVIAQLWGKQPENFYRIASEIADGTIPGFVGIDLNFGCPERHVVKNECCSALAQPHLRDKALAIIHATQSGAGSVPLSIKTRLGFSAVDYSWHEFLLMQKPDMLTVHMRTTKQMSKVPAQWEAISPIISLRDRLSSATKIVLNGDITDRTHGLQLARAYGVDGIMIGRGIFHNPFCFADNPNSWLELNADEKLGLLTRHLELYAATYSNRERPFAPLKKFAKVYLSGFSGAAELRERIMNTSSVEEMQACIRAVPERS